jgi:molecular chaperone GrpE
VEEKKYQNAINEEILEPEKKSDLAEEIPEETIEDRSDEKADTTLDHAEEKLEQMTNQMMRLQADFENYKKRTIKEKTEIGKYALEGFINKLLPVLDNIDRAVEALPETQDGYIEGVLIVFNQLKEILEKEGLSEIDTLGKPFDPNFHHCVVMGEDPDKASNEVLEVLQKGYELKGKVLRPTMVMVNQ